MFILVWVWYFILNDASERWKIIIINWKIKIKKLNKLVKNNLIYGLETFWLFYFYFDADKF